MTNETGPGMRTIYIPSRQRADCALTARILKAADMRFFLVVEPQDQEDYEQAHGRNSVLVLPENDQGVAFSRSWIKQYSRSRGEKDHWQIDDNISWFGRRVESRKDKRIPIPDEELPIILEEVERTVAKYEHIGASGLSYADFAHWKSNDKPLSFNVQVFSAMLINNEPEVFFRPNCIDDVDFSLQLLYAGWHTIQFNHLLMSKYNALAGGLTELYQARHAMKKRVEAHCALWPGKFQYKETSRMERVLTYRLKPSPVWREFRNRPPRLKEPEEGLLALANKRPEED